MIRHFFNTSKKYIFSVIIIFLLIWTACDDVKNDKGQNSTSSPNIEETEDTDNTYSNDNDSSSDQENTTFFGITQEDIYTHQGPNQCGPACFYMVFKYYKDYTFEGTLSISPDCIGDSILNGISEIFSVILSDSWVSQWLNTNADGITCDQFIEKIGFISICEADVSRPFYSAVEGSCAVLGIDSDNPSSAINMEKKERFSYIVTNYLINKYPVLIHLRRGTYYPGHWIVLTGYDSKKNEVYYMNPLKEDTAPIIETIGYDSFIIEGWYTHADFWWYPDAYWDGTWIGFHH